MKSHPHHSDLRIRFRKAILPSLVGTACFVSGQAGAAGFALIEMGASGLGNAYAGASAVSADSSTVWFNPAGMLELEGAEFAVAAHVLGTDNTFTDRGSRTSTLLGGAPVSGPSKDQPGGATFLPNLFYVRPINEKLSFGFGVTVPFGSGTEYDDDWTGRYLTVESAVRAFDLNPTIAYKINDKVSIGAGISVQMMSATLGSAVDSGAVCASAERSGSAAPGTCQQLGLAVADQATDSYAEVTGDNVGVTFNVSALFKPSDATRLGVAYRHSIEHELDGDVDFRVSEPLAQLLAAGESPLFMNGGASATADLPAQLAFSIAHQTTDKLQLLGDLTWTGWSSIQEIRVVFDNEDQPDSNTPLSWEDVIRVSAGANFKLNEKVTLRGGLAYDQEAIPSPNFRSPRVPGNDRTWVAFGAGYRVNPSISLDVGFAHLMLDETPIDYNVLDAAGSQVVRGLYDTSINILSAQFNWHFK